MGANGTPLDVVGKVNIGVSLGSYSVEEEFTVIRNLTVDHLLGADFFERALRCYGLPKWHSQS